MLLLVTGIVSEIENLKILNYLINIINAVLFNLLDICQFSGSYWVWQSDIGKGRFMKNESTFCNFWGSFVSWGGMIFFSVFQLTIMEIPGMCSLNDEAVLSQLQIKITPWIYAAKRASTPFFRQPTEGSVDCVQDNACTKAEWFEAFAKGVICKNDHSWFESKFHFLNNNRRSKVQSQTYKEFLPVYITRLAQLEKPDRCCGSQMVVAKSNWTAKEFTCFVRRNREQNNLLQIKEQIQFSAFTFWKIGDGVWHCVWTALYR